MDLSAKGFELAGTLGQLQGEGRLVLRGRHRPILVVQDRGRVFALDNRCPHMGFPLAQELDRYLTSDGELIMCSFHGALFRPHDGVCIGGPCAGQRLSPWPVEVRDGVIRTA